MGRGRRNFLKKVSPPPPPPPPLQRLSCLSNPCSRVFPARIVFEARHIAKWKCSKRKECIGIFFAKRLFQFPKKRSRLNTVQAALLPSGKACNRDSIKSKVLGGEGGGLEGGGETSLESFPSNLHFHPNSINDDTAARALTTRHGTTAQKVRRGQAHAS